ncbi:rRNA biogenesis protein rrp5 [Malassezia japonica]|uniref:rRNA biogenesis protein rrp5 n=1 Tax=Malassezia japonica TaxID=223818 RepID=A0AAF0EUM4_9BASI|nr:rRNA biogenesis protein rrp5 [Malassezia japonica]WFD37443.1 rRNA biogenesis protein rrp5 [Malassezia japonica]
MSKASKRGADVGEPAKRKAKSDEGAVKRARTEGAPLAPHLASRPQLESFPRGGGTGLTPIEYRQTLLEGRRELADDDLFAESSSKKKKAAPAKAKKAKQTRGAPEAPKDKTRVEMLNYKRLLPGTKMLCNVLAVHPLALVVSMCDQLVGHIPVTSVSARLTDRLQKALDEEDVDDDLPEHDQSPPELRDIYKVGQWVLASVENVAAPNAKRQWGMGREGGEYERESQRVQFSMDPRIVNEGVSVSDLGDGYLLPATITSHEDHGYALDLGLESKVHGFLPSANAGDEPLRLGQVVLVAVEAVASNGRAVRCTLPTHAPRALKTAPNQAALLPGECVRALVTSHTPHGLGVKLFGMLDGTVDNAHLPPAARDDPSLVAAGKKVTLRVLWNMPADLDEAFAGADAVGARRIGLSGAPHILGLRAPREGDAALPDAYPIGSKCRVRVVSVASEWGLLCEVLGKDVQGFVHISRVADEHIDALPPSQGAYKIGSEHEARVVGHAMTDRLLLLSTQPSILAKQYMRVSEVPLGEVVRASVRRVTPKAIFLRLNGNVDGVVFPLHFSDVHLKHPEKKYKPNLELNAKVIHTDPSQNRIVLSLKRSLIESELPFIGAMDDARVGVVTNAVVLKHLQKSFLVELGGTVRAVVPFVEASDTALTPMQLAELYPPAKVVKVRLTHVEPETGRIVASIKQTAPAFLEKLNVDTVDIGEKVAARVASIRDDVAILVLEPAGTRALLALSSLARMRKTNVKAVREEVSEGDLLDGLYVLNKVPEKGLVILGDISPSQKAAVAPGSEVKGRVTEVHKKQLQCTVQLPGCRARLHLAETADDLEKAALPEEGETVVATVLDTRRSGREADISTRASRADASIAAVDPAVDSASQLEVGAQLRGLVKAVTDKGVYVSLGRRTDARVMIKELFDEYVKDFRTKFHVGQLVKGTVLSVDGDKVEFSLKASRMGAPVSKERKTSNRLRDYAAGDKVDAYIRGTAEYGVFVQINDTDISGLCHKSELSDTPNADAVRAFAVGDRVKAVVLKVEADKGRISFGLKPSYFSDADYEVDEDEEDDEDDEDLVNDEDEDLVEDDVEMKDDDEEEDDDEDDDEDDEDLIDDEAQVDDDDDDDEEEEKEEGDDDLRFINDDDEDEDEDDEDENEDEDEDEDENDNGGPADYVESGSDSEPEPAPQPTLSLQDGFRWDAPLGGDDDESSDEEDAAPKRPKKAAISEDITADLASKKLESASDFERLLLGSPNSSYLWIQFVSFYLQLGDVDKARQVARRAIQTINFREEQEKLNVWIALMNVENMYGTPETLAAVFREATQVNNAKEVHLRLLAIYEQSNKINEAIELFRRTAKKFGYSAGVWVQWYQFYLRHGRPDDAHALVPRSLQSLERQKHIKALTAYALSEYKVGDVEHARTLFETLVERYPKRLDLWWQYIDQEARLENIAGVRTLFERAMTSRSNSTKQTKALLQKWLVLEKRIGDAKGVQAVLNRAREFVASVQGEEAS